MEDLVFLLRLNQYLILEIESGRSIYSGLSKYKYKRGFVDSYLEFQIWKRWFEQSKDQNSEPHFSYPLTQNYFVLIKEGLSGAPILDKLKTFESEVLEHIELQLQIQLNRLPYLLMIPLMLFIFPSYLILMLGPILSDVFKSI